MKIDIYHTDRQYDVIYADPPWKYRKYSGKGEGKRTAENHYDCMELKDLKEMPVKKIAKKDCMLFMWVTFPCLKEGLELMEAWGFKYKTCGFVWVKRNKKSDSWFFGLGHYTRANAEICLIGTKGHPKVKSRSVSQICDARVAEHSKKPDEIRDRIVKIAGGGYTLSSCSPVRKPRVGIASETRCRRMHRL